MRKEPELITETQKSKNIWLSSNLQYYRTDLYLRPIEFYPCRKYHIARLKCRRSWILRYMERNTDDIAEAIE